MQSHPDSDSPQDSPQLKNLKRRAEAMVGKGESEITAGRPGEVMLSVQQNYGMTIVQWPEDPDCLRISIGEVQDGSPTRYLTYRGDPKKCLDLLERAVNALRHAKRTP